VLLTLFNSIPVIKLDVDAEVLSGEDFHVQRGTPQLHSARNESAGVFGRGGIGSDRDIRQGRRGMPWDGYVSTDMGSGDMAAVDYVYLNERTVSDIADGNLGLQHSGLRGRNLVSRYFQGLLSGVGCGLCSLRGFPRDGSLPYSYAKGQKSSDHQGSCQPSKSLVRFDLRSLELVLLIFACFSELLFITLRFIKNDSASFLVEESGAVIVFLIGQFFVYLLCKRLGES